MKKPEMGSVVTVTKVMYRLQYYDRDAHNYVTDRRHWWESMDTSPRAGWVVGYRHLLAGRVEPDDLDYGNRFVETGERTPVILVAYWPTMNPVEVPLDGWEEGGEPYPPNGSPEERAEAKRWFARYEDLYQRDAKGRFVQDGEGEG